MHLDIVPIELVDVIRDLVTLNTHANKTRFYNRRVAAVRTRDGAWIDEPSSFVLVRGVHVSVASDENIDVELSRQNRKALVVAPGYNLVPVADAYLELSDGNNLIFRETRHFIHISPHNMYARGEGAQKVMLFSCAKISRANYVLHLVRNEHLAKFFVDRGGAVGHMEIAQNEHKFAVTHGVLYVCMYVCLFLW